MGKIKEIVFHRPNARNVLFSSELPGIENVLCAKLLGVWLQADMGMIPGSMFITFCTFLTSERCDMPPLDDHTNLGLRPQLA